MHIRKGDTVQIKSGKDRGRTGKVIKVDLKNQAIIAEGINLFKKHVRPKRQGEKGEVVTVPRPLAIAKVMLYCSNCQKGVRAGVRPEGGTKVRYCRKCQVSL